MVAPSPNAANQRPHVDERVVRGPVVLLPPRSPGAPERRIAIQPSKVFLLLTLCFGLGGVVAAGSMWVLTQPLSLRQDYERLSTEMEDLRADFATLQNAASKAATDLQSEVGSSTDNPKLTIPIASLPTAQPKVRIAVLSTTEQVILRGEGLHFVHAANRSTPMPGRARIKPANGGVWVEGVGTLKLGTPVESRIGPIRIGDLEYPGRLELHREGDKLLLINEVDMEDYVAGVVASELPTSWGLEAKKAQAVAARSYAFMQRQTSKKPYHLESTVADQVYLGTPVDATSRAAVTATHGQVLASDDHLISAFFSSTCGGHTEEPANVWPNRPAHGVSPAQCGYCTHSTVREWTASVPVSDLLNAARAEGHRATTVKSLHIRSRSATGRVTAIDLVTDAGAVSWTGNEFREHLGWDRARSTLFTHRVEGDHFILSGTGFGHGVGLCQWGAQGMDRRGLDYRQILDLYFAGSDRVQVY